MPSRKAELVLGVDVDGTSADFHAGIRRVAAEWLGKPSDDLTTEVSYRLGEPLARPIPDKDCIVRPGYTRFQHLS